MLWASVVLIMLVAAFLRLYRLHELPPGLYHDEAYNGVDAVGVLMGERAIYFPANNGREPIFIYLQALSVHLLGQSPLALRFPAAVIGLLTVAAMFPLARELWRSDPRRDYLAPLSTLFLSTLAWHLHFSRTGFRAILLPLVVIGALYFFLRAQRQAGPSCGRIPWIWVGLVVGGGLYTYLSAAFVPALLVVLVAYGSWRLRDQAFRLVRGLMVAALVALVVFSPLAVYFLIHPDQLTAHSGEVSFLSREYGGDNPVVALRENAVKAAGMFFWAGDPNWRHNVADWPMLDPLSAALFGVAIGLSCWRFRRPEGAVPLLSLVVMLMPTVFSSQGAPHALRGIGVTPAVALLMAQGALGLWDGFKMLSRRTVLGPGWVWTAALALVIAIGGGAYVRYFIVWGQSPQVYEAFETDIAQSAVLLAEQRQVWQDKQLLVALPGSSQRPTFTFLAPQAQPHWIEAVTSLGAPEEPGDAFYLFPASTYAEVAQIDAYFGPASLVNDQLEVPNTPQGGPAALVFYLPHGAPFPAEVYEPPRKVRGTLGNIVQILGVDYPSQIASGTELVVTTLWQPLLVPRPDYSLFLHLTDDKGRIWAQRHYGGWPDSRWRFVPDGGERQSTVVGWYRLGLEPTMPPGDYTISLGVSSPDGKTILPVADAEGNPGGDRLTLGQVKVVKGKAMADVKGLKVERPPQGKLNADLELLGYKLDRSQLKPGGELRVHLYWKALRSPVDYLRSLALVAPDGGILSQLTSAPVDGRYPTSRWSEGEVVHEMVDLPLRATVPAGEWGLRVALQSQASEPFPMDQAVSLGKVTVMEVARSFAVPDRLPYPTDAVLGGMTRLLGYEVEADGWPRVKAGQTLSPTLHWQGLQEMDESYTVFVQLLDQDQRLVAQSDSLPRDGQHPTTGWLPNEVVADAHPLTLPEGLPPGTYRLIAGMYQSQTMQRLPSSMGGDHVLLAEVLVVP